MPDPGVAWNRIKANTAPRMAASAHISPSIDLMAIAPGLAQTCTEYRLTHRARLSELAKAGESGIKIAAEHARVLDGLMSSLFCAASAAASIGSLAPAGRTALVAVGGYGRGLLGFQSDLDVVLLCEDSSDPGAIAMAEAILYPLWDLGLEIGHAVRGVEETLALARDDLRTATTLLDLRRVAGNAGLVDELSRGARRRVFEPAMGRWLDALVKDTEARHERYGGSRFLLEPDVKNGCGGLRDLDVLIWAINIRWGARSLEEGVVHGALLHREVQELEAAREMLWRVRNLLHLRGTGRRQDRLTFEDQEEIATQLGFVGDGSTLGVEQFMQAYYLHARAVEVGVERMLSRARHLGRRAPAPIENLGSGVLVFDGHITLRDSDELERDPALALRLYRHVVKRRLPPYSFARDAITRAAKDPKWCARLRSSREASELFAEHLTHIADVPVRRGSLLAELHEVGLLLAMIPEFEPVTGRVQHDVYHVYTVDVHSVAAVDRMRALMRGEHASDLPVATRLGADVPRPLPLFLGVLLHDIGKGRGRDHSTVGAEMVPEITERLGLTPKDREHVRWLVQEHLSLYHWAMRRDTSDSETIAEVARRVGTLDRLRDLFVLTVADLSTTNPNAMTSWKARMLDELYLATASALENGLDSGGERANAIREEVRVGFVGDVGQAELEAFIESMPDRYVLSNPVDVIRAHAQIARDRNGRELLIALRPGPSEDVTELVIVTDDRKGLLAHVTAALAASRLDVTTAQIYTRVRGTPPDAANEAFDVFHVRRAGPVEGEAIDPGVWPRFEEDLEALLSGRTSAEALLGMRLPITPPWARRHSPAVKTEILVDQDVSPHFTVIDVFTRDRMGLLHTIARVLHEQGLSIALSKITTEGERAADVFYVSDAEGGQLRDAARIAALSTALRDAIEKLRDNT